MYFHFFLVVNQRGFSTTFPTLVGSRSFSSSSFFDDEGDEYSFLKKVFFDDQLNTPEEWDGFYQFLVEQFGVTKANQYFFRLQNEWQSRYERGEIQFKIGDLDSIDDYQDVYLEFSKNVHKVEEVPSFYMAMVDLYGIPKATNYFLKLQKESKGKFLLQNFKLSDLPVWRILPFQNPFWKKTPLKRPISKSMKKFAIKSLKNLRKKKSLKDSQEVKS